MLTQMDLTLLARAALAAVLGFVIGLQREHAGKPAGTRTFALVACGSAVFTGLGLAISATAGDRALQGLITGIGFLGAGTILRDVRGEVHGLTTAAGMWAVTSIGVAVGAGHTVFGVLLAALVFFVLICDRLPILSNVVHRRPHPNADGTYAVTTDHDRL